MSSLIALFEKNNCQMLLAEKLAPQLDLLAVSISFISVQLDDFSIHVSVRFHSFNHPL